MAVLRSLLYYPVFYGFSAILVMASVIAATFGRSALQKVVSLWGVWHFWCVRNLLGIEVVVEGELPQESVLIAVKHESYFEAIDMPRLLDFPAVFAKRELFKIPGWGHSATIYGLIPVAREDGARALRQMLKTARERVKEGRPLVIFPEGKRIAHGAQPQLQSGFVGIYKLLGLDVVPVAVNSGPLYHRLWKRSGTITYRIGEPIPAGLSRTEIEARVHEAINALND